MVRAGLEPAVTGATIEAVSIFEPRSLRRHVGPSEDFVERLTGRTILAAVRRGKFLWFPLSAVHPSEIQDFASADPGAAAASGDRATASPEFPTHALVVHLGMSGQVLLRSAEQPDVSLLRIRLAIDSPVAGQVRVEFVDQRIFGSMAVDHLVPTPDDRAAGRGADHLGAGAALVPSQVAHIARDPLDPAFSAAAFFVALAKRRTGIKRAILDQTLISGIGNIYADEALWAARIHYDQPTDTLSRAKAKLLLTEVRLVLGKALAEGGTSFDSQYVNVNGASGYFSHSLNAYGQQGAPCPRCGRPLIRESFMNRGSHFCPFCQKIRSTRR